MKVYVIGAGLGHDKLLTVKATETIKKADMVLTTKRLSESLNIENDNILVLSVTQIIELIKKETHSDKIICVLATGDVGFYSIASTINKSVSSDCDIEFINGISSFQYFTSKLRTSYEDIKLVSLHGKNTSIVPYVCYNKRVFCLTGGVKKAHDIINELVEYGLCDVFVCVGEKLSDKNERIIKGKACELLDYRFDDLSVILIENKNYADIYKVIKDDEFIRGKSPMTKECVRNLSVDIMNIAPSDIVWDIGAGTGSVTIALAKKANESFVYAIEKESHAIDLIKQNIQKHSTFNISLINSSAPSGLSQLPSPDKVFIGGSTGNLHDILTIILNKTNNVTIVITAVSIETLSLAVNEFQNFGIIADIMCLNVSRAERLGKYNLMKAQNPVYIIKGVIANEN